MGNADFVEQPATDLALADADIRPSLVVIPGRAEHAALLEQAPREPPEHREFEQLAEIAQLLLATHLLGGHRLLHLLLVASVADERLRSLGSTTHAATSPGTAPACRDD